MIEQKKTSKWNRFKQYLLDIFFPRHVKCIFCGGELNERAHNDCCEKCLTNLPFIKNFCARCGEPMSDYSAGVCLRCKRKNYDFVCARSVFEYTNKIVACVHKYKYSGQKFLCEPMAAFLTEYLARWDISPDIVTSVPMFKKKEKARGYNQAKILAEIVAKNFNLPYLDLTIKVKDNPSQTTLHFKERQDNVKDVFDINKAHKAEMSGKTILLIDDVYTTGATASGVSSVLKKNGAKQIYVLTLAHAVINDEI